MLIERKLAAKVKYMGKKFPIVSLTGPRQSGKTTLLKNVFSSMPYVSLEDPDMRLFAENDPRAFLSQYQKGVIIDEAQHVPHLFSYIQTISDSRNKTAQFVLSGSQNFLLNQKISQSLAGRAGILKLLPLSIEELKSAGQLKTDAFAHIHQGFYPRLFDKKIDEGLFYSSYVNSYLSRDVRGLVNVGDLSTFHKFLQLCAGRIGQLLNLSSLANDAGVSVNTIKSWLSVLEAGYIIFQVQPHHKNFRKRLVKTPKLYFWDTGLACYLLSIRDKKDLQNHFLKGGLFENFVMAEIGKYYFNEGIQPSLYFWRDKTGHELDAIIETGKTREVVEIKSSSTVNPDSFKGLKYWNELSGHTDLNLIYTGKTKHKTQGINVLPWQNIHDILY